MLPQGWDGASEHVTRTTPKYGCKIEHVHMVNLYMHFFLWIILSHV